MNTVDLFTLFVFVLGTAESRPATTRRHLEDFADLVHPGPSLEFTYAAMAPASVCGHNLLIDCQYYDRGIPCKIHHVAGNQICDCFNEGSVVQDGNEAVQTQLKAMLARTASKSADELVAKKQHEMKHYPTTKKSFPSKYRRF